MFYGFAAAVISPLHTHICTFVYADVYGVLKRNPTTAALFRRREIRELNYGQAVRQTSTFCKTMYIDSKHRQTNPERTIVANKNQPRHYFRIKTPSFRWKLPPKRRSKTSPSSNYPHFGNFAIKQLYTHY